MTLYPLTPSARGADGFRSYSIPFLEVPVTTLSWIRRVFARPVIRPLRKAPFRARPVLEALEDRMVLSPIVVTNPTDTPVAGKTDLRQAIAQANATVGPATITFDSTVFATPQTITLGGSQLELTDTTGTETIVGPVAGVTVSGGGLSRVFQVDNLVTASISGLTISGGKAGSSTNGGGLSNLGTATLTNCTVSGNSAYAGGGLNNTGTLALTNCTVSGNSISGYFGGGGLFNNGTATLTNCTVSGNSSPGFGGIYNVYAASTTTLTNTIVAGNSGPFGDIGGSASSGTNNLIGGNPLLAPLGNYGGPTETMALLPGSPAIDAGTSGAGIPTTDQRGLGRVGAVDIGAFESQGFSLTPVAGSTPQTSKIGTPFAPLAVTVTANNPIEPVNGGVVSFVANRVSGATAILSAPSAVIAGGQAAVIAEPNNAVGSYTVVASAGGSFTGSFALTNAGPVFTSLVVNTTSDSLFPGTGHLSLPEAVTFANLDSAGISAITFDPTVFAKPQTITLAGTQLELSNTSEKETITGPKAGVTVSGGGNSRVFQVDNLVTASLSGLTISGGATTYANGGGLLNLGTVSLTNCTVTGNSASGYGDDSGGGVYNAGTATLTNCTVSGNTGGGSFFSGGGGGVANGSFFGAQNATLTMANCTLSGNSAYAGGGLYNGAKATLTNCTVSGNTASSVGGGVSTGSFGNSAATTTLTGCTISGNHVTYGSGGGVSNDGTTTLTNCTISGNSASFDGGGLFSGSTPFNGGNVGTLTLTNCTISGNSAATGGGVDTLGGIVIEFFGPGQYQAFAQDATTSLTNCTVSGNSASADGGGLATGGAGTTTATNITVSGNTATGSGGGLDTSGEAFYGTFDGTTNLTNCTVSGNTATGSGGGLDNASLGSTTVTGTIVKKNTASVGGGIANQATLSVASSTINNNTATSAGGGISMTAGTATITSSVINSNEVNSSGTALGGGIDCENATLSLNNDTVNANQANGTTALGGGIYALNSTVNVKNSTVNGNKANGAVLGEGGGIYSFDSVLTLVNSIVKGNKATTDFDDLFVGP